MYGYDIFHEKLIMNLLESVRHQNPAQAYIFEGEIGLGRYEAARLVAAALACPEDMPPCGRCNSCVSAKSGTNPDIVDVLPQSGHKSIGVPQVRELIKDAYTKPFLSRRKIYIFRDASIITEPAQNALLKILEEPPEYVVFIIIAQNAQSLLNTVRSRCVLVRFAAVGDEVMSRYIDRICPGAKNKDFVIRYARGVPYTARKIVSDENFEPFRQDTFSQFCKLFSEKPLTAFELGDYAAENKDNISRIVELWREFARDMLLICADTKDMIINIDYADKLYEMAAVMDEKKILFTLKQIMNTELMLSRYVSVRAAIVRLALVVGEY